MTPDLLRLIETAARRDRALAHAVAEYRGRIGAGISAEWAAVRLLDEARQRGAIPRYS